MAKKATVGSGIGFPTRFCLQRIRDSLSDTHFLFISDCIYSIVDFLRSQFFISKINSVI